MDPKATLQELSCHGSVSTYTLMVGMILGLDQMSHQLAQKTSPLEPSWGTRIKSLMITRLDTHKGKKHTGNDT